MNPEPRSIEVPHVILDFFVFRQVMFARIFLHPRASDPVAISLRLWNGQMIKMETSADPIAPTTAERLSFCFHYALPTGLAADDIGRISLVIDYPDGRCEIIEPARQGRERDEFLKSEEKFWAAVQANPSAKVLEIGSRARSAIVRKHLFPPSCHYVGFDLQAGENVDVVGDAHALSRFLPRDYFDFVFSVSVWEHLAMPWLVSLELNRVMKVGAIAMVNTHQSWPIHDQPCDYLRFSDVAWNALFNTATGFEIIERGMGLPCVMRPSIFSRETHNDGIEWHYGYLASRVVVRKIAETNLSWPVDPANIVSPYPG